MRLGRLANLLTVIGVVLALAGAATALAAARAPDPGTTAPAPVARSTVHSVMNAPEADGASGRAVEPAPRVSADPASTISETGIPRKAANPPDSPIAQTFDAAIAIRDIIKAQLNRKVFIFPVLCFPDMAPDPIIEARAAEGHVTVLWGGDDLIGRLKELAKTQTIHRPPTAERIAQEVELIQPGMGHPAGAPAPASAPANADAVVELPGGRLVVHVHVHLPRDPLTLG